MSETSGTVTVQNRRGTKSSSGVCDSAVWILSMKRIFSAASSGWLNRGVAAFHLELGTNECLLSPLAG